MNTTFDDDPDPKFEQDQRVIVQDLDSGFVGQVGRVDADDVTTSQVVGQPCYIVYLAEVGGGMYVSFREEQLVASPYQGEAVDQVGTDSVTVTFPRETAGLLLNPADPFEAVLIDMVETNRRKRRDYAVDGSPFSNFDDTSKAMGIDGFSSSDSALFNVHQKLARLKSLRANGRMDDPENESVTDTYLDLAVYAVIALAIHTHPTGKVA